MNCIHRTYCTTSTARGYSYTDSLGQSCKQCNGNGYVGLTVKHDYMQTEHCQTNVQVTHDNDTLAEI